MDPIVGIDLGTTFSAVSHLRDGRPVILANGAERITPSSVGFSGEGVLLVGTPALNQYVLHPDQTVRSIKRRMGTDEGVTLNGRDYSPTEISAIILREMKRIAEARLGTDVNRAVITVPAYFSDAARQATRDAGELAGFTVERILNEPTAAALAYGLDRSGEQQLIAVYDLGGGTFDVSIVEMNQGVLEVRASHGDTHLGGDDFDEALMNHLADGFQELHDIDPRSDPRARARLLRAAEQAKIALSSQPFVQVREEYLLERDGQPLHLDVEVERRQFEELIYDRIEGTLKSFDQALSDAGVKKEQLDHVIFVGGSTRIPLVWNMVAVHTGREPMNEINPDEAVALGAAVQAAIIAGEPIDAILVDVTPHTLGIAVAAIHYGEVVPDQFGPIIHRNTALPTRQAQVFSTLHPSQKAIEVKIYQGEEPIASENTLLGEFLFDDLKPERPGELARITVEFDLDLNGILHVSAKDRGSNQVRQTTVKAAHVRMTPAQAEASAQHLSELAAGAAGTADTEDPLLTQARALVDRPGVDTTELKQVINAIDLARLQGDDAAVELLTNELVDLLYELGEA